jgi:hypothetical protein
VFGVERPAHIEVAFEFQNVDTAPRGTVYLPDSIGRTSHSSGPPRGESISRSGYELNDISSGEYAVMLNPKLKKFDRAINFIGGAGLVLYATFGNVHSEWIRTGAMFLGLVYLMGAAGGT